jgi:hypothetical protein
MTTLISIPVLEGIALFTDSSITYFENQEKRVNSQELKHFEAKTPNVRKFVIQITGELDFPRHNFREKTISSWISTFIKKIEEGFLNSIEEISNDFYDEFLVEWNSTDQRIDFGDVYFWISGRTQKETLSTVELGFTKDIENPKRMLGKSPKQVPEIFCGPQIRSTSCGQPLLWQLIFEENPKFSAAVLKHEKIDPIFGEMLNKVRSCKKISCSELRGNDQVSELILGAMDVIETHAKFIGCLEMASAAQKPIRCSLIGAQE